MGKKQFSDRLVGAVRAKGNSLCVGLDPIWQSIPEEYRVTDFSDRGLEGVADAYEAFCCRVIDIVAPLVSIVKPQAAYFESCGAAGFGALQRVLQHAKKNGLLTILDGKRNDIASTAAAYADAAFGGSLINNERLAVWDCDAVTINPYMGRDAIEPFLRSARAVEGGVFVLVRTSNPGAGLFQDLMCDGRPIYMYVAQAVANWTKENLGYNGLGDVGAVVGATEPDELRSVRAAIPEAWFLIPGFGAQGGTAADTAAGFRSDGLGAIVNSSRQILYPTEQLSDRWAKGVERATKAAIDSLRKNTPMGKL